MREDRTPIVKALEKNLKNFSIQKRGQIAPIGPMMRDGDTPLQDAGDQIKEKEKTDEKPPAS